MKLNTLTHWGAACVFVLGLGTGAQAADTEVVFGLVHTPLGAARIVPDGEDLLLTQLEPDGNAGVHIATGSAGGVLLDLGADGQSVLSGPGTFAGYTLSFTTLKQGGADHVGVLVEGGDAGQATLSIDGAFPENVTVSALRVNDDEVSETVVWSYTAVAPYDAPLATGAIGTEPGDLLRMTSNLGIEKCTLAVENMYQEKDGGESCGEGASITIGGIGAGGVAQPGGDPVPADLIRITWDRPASAVRPLEGATLRAYRGPDESLRLSGVGTIFQDAEVRATGDVLTNPLYEADTGEGTNPLYESSMSIGSGGGAGSGRVSISSFDLTGAKSAFHGGGGGAGKVNIQDINKSKSSKNVQDDGRKLGVESDGAGGIQLSVAGGDGSDASDGVVSLYADGNLVAEQEFGIGPGIEVDVAEGSLGGSQSMGTLSHAAFLCVRLLPNGTITLVECGFVPESSAEAALCDAGPCDTYTLLLPTGSTFALPGEGPVPVDQIRVTNRVSESLATSGLVYELESGVFLDIEQLYRVSVSDDPDDLDVPPIDGGLVAVGSNVCFEIPNPNAVNIQWDKDGVLMTGRTNRRLCIANVQISDSGRYRAVFEDGNKAIQEYVVILNVVNQVPAAGLGGLAMLVLGLAAGGGAVLFRRGRRQPAH